MKDKGLLEWMLPVAKQQLGQAVDSEAWDDFRVKSESDSDLDADCFAGRRYRSILITAGDLDEIFKTSPDSGWEEFYKRFPGTNGYLQLSHVGFNASKDKALVYVGMSSGPLAGAGGIMLLHEEGSSWIVDAGATLWMS